MLEIRPAKQRGHADHGWLNTYHTFSFADYYDPRHQGFRVLRVINEDRVGPGQGFAPHQHRDMEILSYVMSGALQHRDSLGHGSVLKAGEWQRITAGDGIEHSEFNPSGSEPVHFYQIWIRPNEKGLAPSYEQQFFPPAESRNQLRIVASPDGRDGSLTIRQDAIVSLATLDAGHPLQIALAPNRYGWLQVTRGAIELERQPLSAGDGVAMREQPSFTLQASEPAEIVFFDLP